MTSDGENRPLRIAYVRLVQAALAIHLEKIHDAELGGGRWLDRILDSIEATRRQVESLATAEKIDLIGPDE